MIKRIFLFLCVFYLYTTPLNAKKILILNASSGLGNTVAEKLNQKGDILYLTARNLDKVDKVKGTKIELDFTNPSNDLALKLKNIDLDGIVIITPRPKLGANYLPEADAWRKCFEEGFIGPLEALRTAIPKLNPGGKIVVIGGLTSVSALDNHQHFSVLRMMWLGQAKGLSRILGKNNIHVNSIALGGTLTKSFKASVQKRADNNERDYRSQLKAETDNIPLKRYADPEQVADVVDFLLSNKSDHITGVNIPMDGGFSRGY